MLSYKIHLRGILLLAKLKDFLMIKILEQILEKLKNLPILTLVSNRKTIIDIVIDVYDLGKTRGLYKSFYNYRYHYFPTDFLIILSLYTKIDKLSLKAF